MLKNVDEDVVRLVEQKDCPLCGEENDCGVTKGEQQCWCMAVEFPQHLLATVAQEPKSCICQRCLNTYKKDQLL